MYRMSTRTNLIVDQYLKPWISSISEGIGDHCVILWYFINLKLLVEFKVTSKRGYRKKGVLKLKG